MSLTDSQIQQVQNILAPLLERDCSVCGSRDWIVPHELFELRRFTKRHQLDSIVIPLFQVHCESCGQTHLFNAIKLGLVERDKPDELDSPENIFMLPKL